MSIIKNSYINRFFEERPQLKRPIDKDGNYRINKDWVPLVEGLIAIAERPCNTQMHVDKKPKNFSCKCGVLNIALLPGQRCICGEVFHE